jgi:threonine/homoserine/homoserine lactone efflux protein
MSLKANMKRPITFVGGMAAASLFFGVMGLVVAAVQAMVGMPFSWAPIGGACYLIWMFFAISARGGMFKDAQAMPAQ